MAPLRRRTLLQSTAIMGAGLVAGCLGDGGEYGEEWLDVERVTLEAMSNSWVGVEPEPIAEANNPTLRLIHGRTYDIEWRNGDGQTHTLEIRNSEGDPIEESTTRSVQDDTARLSFDAVAGVTSYACPHFEVTMTGSIEIFST